MFSRLIILRGFAESTSFSPNWFPLSVSVSFSSSVQCCSYLLGVNSQFYSPLCREQYRLEIFQNCSVPRFKHCSGVPMMYICEVFPSQLENKFFKLPFESLRHSNTLCNTAEYPLEVEKQLNDKSTEFKETVLTDLVESSNKRFIDLKAK